MNTARALTEEEKQAYDVVENGVMNHLHVKHAEAWRLVENEKGGACLDSETARLIIEFLGVA
jgi:hypothetical protein